MTDPIRLRLMKQLTTILEGVSSEDSNSGYVYTLTGSVFRGRTAYGDDDALPMVSILEVPVAPEPSESAPENPSRAVSWDLLIQGFVDDDKDNPTDPAYLLSADVIKALAKEKTRIHEERRTTGKVSTPLLGERAVKNLSIGAPVHRPPDEISAKAYFWLPITILFAENLEDPLG